MALFLKIDCFLFITGYKRGESLSMLLSQSCRKRDIAYYSVIFKNKKIKVMDCHSLHSCRQYDSDIVSLKKWGTG